MSVATKKKLAVLTLIGYRRTAIQPNKPILFIDNSTMYCVIQITYILCSVCGKSLFNICLVFTITKSLLSDKNVANILLSGKTSLKVWFLIKNVPRSLIPDKHVAKSLLSGKMSLKVWCLIKTFTEVWFLINSLS